MSVETFQETVVFTATMAFTNLFPVIFAGAYFYPRWRGKTNPDDIMIFMDSYLTLFVSTLSLFCYIATIIAASYQYYAISLTYQALLWTAFSVGVAEFIVLHVLRAIYISDNAISRFVRNPCGR